MSPAVDTEQATLLYIYGASAFSCLFIILMIVVDVGGAMSDRETLCVPRRDKMSCVFGTVIPRYTIRSD